MDLARVRSRPRAHPSLGKERGTQDRGCESYWGMNKGEREKTEPDDIGGDVFDDDSATELQEVLKMSVRILVR